MQGGILLHSRDIERLKQDDLPALRSPEVVRDAVDEQIVPAERLHLDDVVARLEDSRIGPLPSIEEAGALQEVVRRPPDSIGLSTHPKILIEIEQQELFRR